MTHRMTPSNVRLWVAVAVATSCLAADAQPARANEKREREAILSLIAPRAGETICDLGCGSGRWTFALARAVGVRGRVYAVDIDRRSLDEVKQRRDADQVPNVEVVLSLPDDPRLPKATMDAVFLNDVIDYVDRRALAGFLAGIRESLRPSGRLIVRDPNGGVDRVIAECHRAGFVLVEAKIPLDEAPKRSFSDSWYALKLRLGEGMQPAILPRLGKPARYRTRLHLAEELFRAGLLSRDELRELWETVHNIQGAFDPRVDEAEDLITAAQALGVVTGARVTTLRARARERANR